jgi:hypothetical protein
MGAVAADPLARLRLAGFAGTTLLALGAMGAGVWPSPDPARDLPVLGVLRAHPAAGILLALAGMAVLVTAWWRVGTRGEGPPPVRWTAVTVALWSLPLAVAPPLFSRDVYSYAAQGDVFLHGLDPYSAGPAALPSVWLESVSVTWWDTPAPYGPLFLLAARAVVEVCGGHLLVAVFLLRLVAVAGVALVGATLPALARGCGIDDRRAMWLGFASPLLLVHAVSGAHNDALMIGLLVAGLACAVQRRPVLAALLIALAATVKAPALLALPFVALLWPAGDRSPRGATVRGLLSTAALTVAVFVAAGAASGLGLGWVPALRTSGETVQWTSVPTGLGLAARWLLEAVGGGPGAGAAALVVTRAIGAVGALAIVAALWWRVRDRADDPRAVVAACGWAFAAVVLLAPAFHPWYALWALVPLAASTVDRRVLAVATAALCFLVLPDGFSLARATVLPGVLLDVAVTVAAVVVAVLAWRDRRPTPTPAGTAGTAA